MRYLILGASGLVGGNCMNYFEKKGEKVMGTYFSFAAPRTYFFNTLDLDDSRNMNINDFRPEVIVHCGALTHVDYCENNIDESYEKTVISTKNALQIAKKFNAQFVYLSTDYVFDGSKGFYNENDTTNPLSIYGKHKLEAENLVRKQENHLIVRITNVYGDEIRGKNFVSRLIENLGKNEPMDLKLPYDQLATPVNALDVARAIHLLTKNKHTGIYHLGSVDYLNRVQLAAKILKYFGHQKVKLQGVSTASMHQAAARPLKGGFDSSKFISQFPNFRFLSVDEYLLSKKEHKNLMNLTE